GEPVRGARARFGPVLRGLLKTAIAGGLSWSGADRLWRRRNGDGPWIVGYHRVVEDVAHCAPRTGPSMLISRSTLERHLDWIGRRFRLVSLDAIGRELENGGGAAKPAAAITFDDGYRDVYHHAVPLLLRRGVPAAVFVISGLVGTLRPPLHDRLFLLLSGVSRAGGSPREVLPDVLRRLRIEPPAAPRPWPAAPDPAVVTRRLLETFQAADLERIAADLEERVPVDRELREEHLPLTWDMVGEMRRAGFTIGSHTRRHALLTGESPGAIAGEVAGSRRELEARLGIPVRHFAYPNGWFDRAAVRAVADAGYRYAYTTCRHRDPDHPRLTLPRTLLWERSATGPLGRFSPTLMGWQAPGACRPPSGCGPDHARRAADAS
ncbi:MAG: polysaccharide deacetylase family protein, partial [Candidatus Polarisedimenticolia bacterium]